MQWRGGRQYPESLCLKGKTTLFCTRNHNRSALLMNYVVVFLRGFSVCQRYLKIFSEPSFIKKQQFLAKNVWVFVVFSVSELRFFPAATLPKVFKRMFQSTKDLFVVPKKTLSPEVPQVHWFGLPQCLPNCARGRGA